MTFEIHRAKDRGSADYDWLHTHYSFSFSNYYNPKRMGFGALRVLNDDIIDAGAGFETHPHDNMEIVTIVLEGSVKHKDSMGNEGIIPAGDIQRMSAGTGILHSEANASKTQALQLLQIWVVPQKRNISPSYEQKTFLPADRKNRLQPVVAPQTKGALAIHQDARFYLSSLEKGNEVVHEIKSANHGVFLFVIKGTVDVSGEVLHERDSIEIIKEKEVKIKTVIDSELLLIEVPM